VIITSDIDGLLHRTGYGVTSDGTLIRTDTVRQLADSAEVYTAFLTKQGEVLRLGRTRRIATRSQTIALIARDGGCSFSGCDASPEWCEVSRIHNSRLSTQVGKHTRLDGCRVSGRSRFPVTGGRLGISWNFICPRNRS
jgi:hypothetical protein